MSLTKVGCTRLAVLLYLSRQVIRGSRLELNDKSLYHPPPQTTHHRQPLQ
jgi:hypothetical protein